MKNKDQVQSGEGEIARTEADLDVDGVADG